MSKLDELNEVAMQKIAIRNEKYVALKQHIESVVKSFIPSSLASYAEVFNITDEHVEIGVTLHTAEGKSKGHSFDLYFHRPWGRENESRKLEMNFGCFGSFGSDDTLAIMYCQMLNAIATSLADIQNKLLFSDEGKKAFSEYKSADHDAWKARDEVKKLLDEQKAKEHEAKKEEVLRKIAVGTKILCGKRYNGDPVIYEIEHVTSKNILFKEDYGKRTKKEVLIDNLVRGDWKFAN